MKRLKSYGMKSFFSLWVIALSILTVAMVGTATAKSLYVISDIAGSPTPIDAYDIQLAPTYLFYQTTHNVPRHAMGAVDITIDTDSGFLFVTYEGSIYEPSTIEIIDGATMTSQGTITAPGAGNLAGIVVDQHKQKVYAVDRDTDNLYIYSWDATTKTLTLDVQVDLSGVSNAQGLALDEVNNLLYVGEMTATNNIRAFSTADWSQAASYTVSQPVQGIAVDATDGFIYTGHAGWEPETSLHLLCKLDMDTGIETNVDIRTLTTSVEDDAVLGLAVDPDTGLLYITTGNEGSQGRVYDDTDQIMVFDSDLNLLYSTGDIGNPTGLCVPGKDISYNPLRLIKDDGIEEDDDPNCVAAEETISYDICYDNTLNAYDVHDVTIVDALPSDVSFISAAGGGIYDPYAHTVTWYIGTLPAGAPQDCVDLVVQVDGATPPGTILDNACTINGAQAGTGPTTKHEYTEVCFGMLVDVDIDIKPGSYPNAINLRSHGLVPVAILSSEQFDATTVDPETVELAGSGVAMRGKSKRYMAHKEDVNGDGLVDLVLQVATENLDPELFQDGYAILTGATFGGQVIEGEDEITLISGK